MKHLDLRGQKWFSSRATKQVETVNSLFIYWWCSMLYSIKVRIPLFSGTLLVNSPYVKLWHFSMRMLICMFLLHIMWTLSLDSFKDYTIALITSIVAFIAILICSHSPPKDTRAHAWRDTHLFFHIKEIALLCWLFYLKPWLPLCAPDHAVTETRRRVAALIGAWDARVVKQAGCPKRGASNGVA